ncbi:hypothetical protein V1478_016278 [Vespula squamosa]|uniref:Uncharacterized protein n=1 Tax=Vespula squamosa TaxID=30214 RepID=A0ABD1ZZZ5_VESSQ
MKKEKETKDIYSRIMFIKVRVRLFADPRRQGNTVGTREHGLVLLDQDIAGLPLPDLVSSAMDQLPPPSPQVTVSAPTSPTRDATFQFPECSGTNNVAAVASYANVARNENYENEDEEGAPVPTPRPRPRRRRPINVRVPLKKTSFNFEPVCNGDNTYCEHPGHALRHGQWWISIGGNLRNIADDFQGSKTKCGCPGGAINIDSPSVKTSSIAPVIEKTINDDDNDDDDDDDDDDDEDEDQDDEEENGIGMCFLVADRKRASPILPLRVTEPRIGEQHKRQQPTHRRYFAFHDPSVYKRDDVMGDSGSLARLEACLSSTINP